MKRNWLLAIGLAALAALAVGRLGTARADESFAKIAETVNHKLVKLFGSGGFRGLASYGTGVVVSPDGYILTINSHILDTRDLRVHMSDGTRYDNCKVVAAEPELDVALVKIVTARGKVDLEHYVDVPAVVKKGPAEPGTGVLGFSNQFQIATRDEPMSVQRGVIAAYGKLYGRIGIFEATYRGNVYVIDAITNNPGAGGGLITSRTGEPLGLIGRELRNELTATWINYAIPFTASIEVATKEGKKKVSVVDLVTLKEKYKPLPARSKDRNVVYTGLLLVPNVVERTPPYVEEVAPGSPGAAAKLQPDDLIAYVDGLPTPDINTLNDILAGYTPGTEVRLEVQRGDRFLTVPLTLSRPPAKPKK